LAADNKNTRFFHLRASQRKKKIKINILRKPDGQITEDELEMGRLATTFYKDLYRSEGAHDMDQVLNSVPVKVTTAMNEALIVPFEEEIKETLFQMFPTKALGPDGFPAHFFSSVIGLVRGGSDHCGTLIVFIPKVSNVEELSQYRPISLCNIIYKIASKAVVNRLKGILPQIISEEQSTFVPGRLI
jgi:hypothetical protein